MQGIFCAEQGIRAEAESADDPGPRTATDLLDKALERRPAAASAARSAWERGREIDQMNVDVFTWTVAFSIGGQRL